jgi:hypothetical protein
LRRSYGPILLIVLGLLLVVLYLLLNGGLGGHSPDGGPATRAGEALGTLTALGQATPTVAPSPTPQPVFPTATAGPGGGEISAGMNPAAQPPPAATPDPRRCPLPDCLSRVGVSGRLEDIAAAAGAGLPFGNYFDWWLNDDPPSIPGQPGVSARYWQLVPTGQDGPQVSWSRIAEVVAARPGSIWIVGNEPDVIWQDDVTAAAYATIYHDVYTFIKERDSSAQIAIAGVAQPSPLRFAYLERILATYQELYDQPLPVDIWTIHAFILREQAGSWGVGIPPGIDQEQGLLYTLADHDDLAIFRQGLIDFRDWMAQRGYGDKPLAVTEFGILHPADYGFPPEAVMAFMIGASDFMANAQGESGYPEDDGRLVQYWFWFSVYDHGDFPTGNLYDVDQERLTAVGQAFRRYLVGP